MVGPRRCPTAHTNHLAPVNRHRERSGLTEAGFDVAGKAATPDQLRHRVALTRPDLAIINIKMPPTHRRRLVPAQEIRGSHPNVGVLVLSR